MYVTLASSVMNVLSRRVYACMFVGRFMHGACMYAWCMYVCMHACMYLSMDHPSLPLTDKPRLHDKTEQQHYPHPKATAVLVVVDVASDTSTAWQG